MKKYIIILAALFTISCTDNSRARYLGGTEVVTLPENHVLMNATWKDNQLWILSKDTLTGQVSFHEKSSWGVMEGTINFR